MTGGVKTGSVPLSWEIAFVLPPLIDGGELGGQQLPVNIIITNISMIVQLQKVLQKLSFVYIHRSLIIKVSPLYDSHKSIVPSQLDMRLST